MRLEIVSINMNQMKWNGMNGKRHSTRKSKTEINKYTIRLVSLGFGSCTLFFLLLLFYSHSVTPFFVTIWNVQCAYLNVSTHFLMGNHYDKQRLKWTVHAKSLNHLTSINMWMCSAECLIHLNLLTGRLTLPLPLTLCVCVCFSLLRLMPTKWILN